MFLNEKWMCEILNHRNVTTSLQLNFPIMVIIDGQENFVDVSTAFSDKNKQ